MAVRRLSLVLDLNSGQFSTRITDATGKLRTFSSVASTANKSVTDFGRSAKTTGNALDGFNKSVWKLQLTLYSLTFLFGGLTTGLVKTNAEVQRTIMLLQGLSKEMTEVGRQKEALKSFEYLLDLSKKAPYSLSALTDSFVKFRTAGMDPMNGSMKALVDAVGSMGGTEEQLKRASIAIQQMAGKGVVSMEELRQQLGEAVPQAIGLMARSMGMSVAQLSKLIETGTVQAGPALAKMFLEMERTFGGGAQRMMDTFSGQVSLMKTNLQQLALAVGGLNKDGGFVKGGFMDQLTNGGKDLNTWLTDPQTIAGARELGVQLADLVKNLANFTRWVVENQKAIKALATAYIAFKGVQLLASGFTAARVAVQAYTIALAGLPRVLAIVSAGKGALLARLVAIRGATLAGAAATTAFSGALGVARAALTLLSGPIGWAITALTLLAGAFIKAALAAKELERAKSRALRGNASDDDVDNLQRRRDELAKQVAADKKAAEDRKREGGAYLDPFNLVEKRRRELQSVESALGAAKKTQIDNAWREGQDSMEGAIDAALSRTGAQRKYDLAAQAANNLATSGDQAGAARARAAAITDLNRATDKVIAAKQAEAKNNVRLANQDLAGAKTTEEKTKARLNVLKAEAALAKLEDDKKYILNKRDLDSATDALTQSDITAGGKPKKPKKSDAERLADSRLKRSDTIVHDLGEKATEQAAAASDAMEDLSINSMTTGGQVEKFARKLAAARAEAMELNPALKEGSKNLASLDATIAKATEDFRIASLAGQVRDLKNETYELGLVSSNRFARAWDGYSVEMAKLEAMRSEIGKIKDEAARTTQLKILDDNIAAKTKDAVRSMAESLEEEARSIREGLMTADDAREAAYRREVERIEALTDISKLNEEERAQYAEQFATSRADMLSALDAKRARDAEGPMEKTVRDWQDTNTRMKEIQGAWMDDFTDQMFKGEFTFGGFLERILLDYLETLARARMASVISSGINSLTGALAGALGGIFGGAKPVAAASGRSTKFVSASVAHTGGIAGSASLIRRAVDPMTFHGAGKYHVGGFPGLKPNEVPLIAEKGEGIFTKDQMRAMGKGSSSSMPNVQVNMINESGHQMNAEESGTRFDGEKYVVDIVMSNLSKRGPLRDAFQDR